ncbi:hypothetical protein ACOSQ3_014831 [Xanthoceras sorbifolium]
MHIKGTLLKKLLTQEASVSEVGQFNEGVKTDLGAESHLVEKKHVSSSFSSAVDFLGSVAGSVALAKFLGSVVRSMAYENGVVKVSWSALIVSSGNQSIIQFRDGIVDREEVSSLKVSK